MKDNKTKVHSDVSCLENTFDDHVCVWVSSLKSKVCMDVEHHLQMCKIWLHRVECEFKSSNAILGCKFNDQNSNIEPQQSQTIAISKFNNLKID